MQAVSERDTERGREEENAFKFSKTELVFFK